MNNLQFALIAVFSITVFRNARVTSLPAMREQIEIDASVFCPLWLILLQYTNILLQSFTS